VTEPPRLVYNGRGEREKGVRRMNPARNDILRMIDDMQDQELAEVIDFIGYLRAKREKEDIRNLLTASESSLDFWRNDKDDEVWNDV